MVFLLLCGLVVDIGYLYRQKNKYKNATDAACLAAALYLKEHSGQDEQEKREGAVARARIIAEENGILRDEKHLKVALGYYDSRNEYDDFRKEEGFIAFDDFTEYGSPDFVGNDLAVNAVYCLEENNNGTFFSAIIGRGSVRVSADSVAYVKGGNRNGILYKWCHEYGNAPDQCPYCYESASEYDNAVFPGLYHNYFEDAYLYLGGDHGGNTYYLFNENISGETHVVGQLSMRDERGFQYENAKNLTVYLDTKAFFDSVVGEHSRAGLAGVDSSVIGNVHYGGYGEDRVIIKTKRDTQSDAMTLYTLVGGQQGLQCYLDGVEVYVASTRYKNHERPMDSPEVVKEWGDVMVANLAAGYAGNERDYMLRIIAKGNIHIGHDEDAGDVFTFNGAFVPNPSSSPLFLAGGNIIIDEASVFKNGYIHANGHIILNCYDYVKIRRTETYPDGTPCEIGCDDDPYWYGNYSSRITKSYPLLGIDCGNPVFENCTATCSGTVILRHRVCEIKEDDFWKDAQGKWHPDPLNLQDLLTFRNNTHSYWDEEVSSACGGRILGNQPPKTIPWDWETGELEWDWTQAKSKAVKVYDTDHCQRDYDSVSEEVTGNPVGFGKLD
jgi:hypothetical protein